MNEEKLIPVIIELNTLLADYHMYYQKLRSHHWDILGENFFELHEKFETLYANAKIKIDEISNKLLAHKCKPRDRYSEYIKISSIKESSTLLNDMEMVNEIINDHNILLVQMKSVIEQAKNADDQETINLLGSYTRELIKSTSMLYPWATYTKEKIDKSIIKKVF